MIEIVKKTLRNSVVPFAGMVWPERNRHLNVIYYHDIVESGGYSYMQMEYSRFQEQMEYLLREGYQTYTFRDLAEQGTLAPKGRHVLITFDDGWLSNYTMVFPLLKKMGLKFNIFLAAGAIGSNPDYMTWEMVEEMARSGMCGFGAHTYDHVNMDDLTGIDLQRQITGADELIEAHTGMKPLDFCFPKGKYTATSLEYFVKKSPYTHIYTSDWNYTYQRDGKVIFGRNAISDDEGMCVFRNKLKGRYDVYFKLKKLLWK